MSKSLTGHYADELTTRHAALVEWNAELANVEAGIQDAVSNRDLDSLITLQAKRNAIPELIRAIAAERDEFQRLRQEAISRQFVTEHETQFADKPAFETLTHPTTPNTSIAVRRFTL